MKAQYFSSFLGMTEIKILFKPDSVTKEEFFSYVDDKVVQPKPKGKKKESKVLQVIRNKADMAKYAKIEEEGVNKKEQTLNTIKNCLNKCKKSYVHMKLMKNCLNDCIKSN